MTWIYSFMKHCRSWMILKRSWSFIESVYFPSRSSEQFWKDLHVWGVMGDGLEASTTTIWSIWLEHGSCVNSAMTSLGDTWAQCCGCHAWERCLIYLVPQVERAPPAQRFFDTSWKGILIWLEMPTVPPHLHIAQSPRPHFRSFVLNTFPNSLELPKCPQFFALSSVSQIHVDFIWANLPFH